MTVGERISVISNWYLPGSEGGYCGLTKPAAFGW
jgi:hypothetical protein